MWIAALFNMQMAGGDCMWRLQNGTKRCDSKSWFAPLVDWLMQRLFTHAASLFSLCMSLRFCLRLCVPWVYVHMYAHMCVFICCLHMMSHPATAKVSHLPAQALNTLTHHLQSVLFPCTPHLPIHLTEGFTLLTVKFTHIHNYVFNQSHLKASRIKPFLGNGRRSKSTLRGLSWLIPFSAICANDWQTFRGGSRWVREAFNLQSGIPGPHAS